ncbi:MAG TPA: hypothetical protein VJ867_08730 [Gemmatimonadaceae bacterium]|nr:hypothetical protein [Gemmatimonadaceae bacterium]
MKRALLWILIVASVLLVAADVAVWSRRQRYVREIDRLRASMSRIERRRVDQVVAAENNRLRTAIELLRRQARLERDLHLSVSVDSGTMYLERDGVELRRMRVEVGPERRVGTAPDTVHLAPPRGVRSIIGLLSDTTAWQPPAWVYADRGIGPPDRAPLVGALGSAAILLDGGTVIYTMPSVGPLNDSGYVLPGSLRAGAQDLRAILPSLGPGVRVYFY